MVTVDIEADAETASRICIESGHTRLLATGIELHAETESYNSVGRLIFGMLGHIAEPGNEIVVQDFTLTVESVDENRIQSVRMSRREAHTSSTESGPANPD